MEDVPRCNLAHGPLGCGQVVGLAEHTYRLSHCFALLSPIPCLLATICGCDPLSTRMLSVRQCSYSVFLLDILLDLLLHLLFLLLAVVHQQHVFWTEHLAQVLHVFENPVV